MSKSVIIDYPAEGLVRIILNRPQVLNALNADLLDTLVRELRAHAHARVILLEGAGDKSFCAGQDLKETLTPEPGSATQLRQAFNKLQDITRLTSSSEAVVVAAVHGFAVGGGGEIALAADIVIGGPETKFRFPEVAIGHAATGGITLRLPHLIGLLRAKELLLTGRWVDADEALKIGLLTELNADSKQRALEIATQLATFPATSLSTSKRTLERAAFFNMDSALADEVIGASHCFSQSDADNAFSSFASRKTAPGENTNKFSAAGKDEPLSRDINSAWRKSVQRFPDRVFLRLAEQDITFRDCDSMIDRVAGGFQNAGIRPKDRILVRMRNSAEMVVSWLASNRLGAVWVPVNTELKSVTLQHVIQAAEAKLAIVDAELWPEMERLWAGGQGTLYIKGGYDAAPHPKFSDLLSSETSVSESSEHVKPSSTAAFLYTSGTTGKSKPCMLSHEYFLIQAHGLIEGCGLQGDDVLYCPFPLFHLDATALTVIPAILLGATAALSVRFSVSRFWKEIRSSGATVYDFMGATLALTYRQSPQTSDQDHRVRLAWGVPLPHFAGDYERRFGHRLVTLYGSVESGLPIFQSTAHPLPVGSCGRARSGYEVRIADDEGNELPTNTTGSLLLRSRNPNAFLKGYFGHPESTIAATAGLWLHTGDLARVDGEGHVYFMGRTKDVVRRRGENINAAEVEEEFLEHPDIITVAAYGVPSQFGSGTEQDLKVAIELRPGSVLRELDVWNWSVSRMARFQVPSVIEFVARIDKTPTGKIDKGAFKSEGGERFDIRTQNENPQ